MFVAADDAASADDAADEYAEERKNEHDLPIPGREQLSPKLFVWVQLDTVNPIFKL